MKLPTTGWLCETLHSTSPLPKHHVIESHSIDSRTLTNGSLFWALKAKRDGHEFISDAFAKGACAAIVGREWFASAASEPFRSRVIPVNDSLTALTDAGRAWRNHLHCPVIGITGSSGKTTTKDFTLHLLRLKYRSTGTAGNLNNELGVPLTLLGMEADSECIVVELGASGSGEIARLCDIARPTHGLVTSISPAHLEGFGSIETVARTKGELYRYLKPNGIVFVPLKDHRCVQESAHNKNRIGFGFLEKPSDWKDELIQGTDLIFDDQAKAAFTVNGERFHLAFPGRPAAHAALASIAIAHSFGVNLHQCATAIANAPFTEGRASVIHTGETTILNDSYNANPASTQAALETLNMMSARRRVAILGDMSELGEYAEHYHRELGRSLQEYKIAEVIFVGPLSRFSVDEAPSGLNVTHFDSVEEILDHVREHTSTADLILVKGSRSIMLEQVVTELTAING